VRVPGQHWHSFAAVDCGPGRRARPPATRRPRRLPRDRQRTQLHDVGAEVVADAYPFDSRFLDRDGHRLHFLDEGSGTTEVMLHGNPTWSYYYRNLVTSLRDRYRCIVPDHIGCGLSDKPQPPQYDYSLASRVNDLTELMRHLGVQEKVTLVLHDWGGM